MAKRIYQLVIAGLLLSLLLYGVFKMTPGKETETKAQPGLDTRAERAKKIFKKTGPVDRAKRAAEFIRTASPKIANLVKAGRMKGAHEWCRADVPHNIAEAIIAGKIPKGILHPSYDSNYPS